MIRVNLSKGLSDAVLAKLRKHYDGAEDLNKRKMPCHYCEHNTVFVFEDARGHVQAKCQRCGMEAVYNVVLRRIGAVMFRVIRG